jgi:hypothetical protein
MRRPRHAQAPTPGTRPPEYVIELWVSEQIKDRIRRAHATPAVPATEPPPARAPEQELEAEP